MSAKSDRNRHRRHTRKAKLVELLGGACMRCGYKRSLSALEFHHRDEGTKEFNISGTRLAAVAWERLLAEVGKCDLLCSNCHKELHDEDGWIHENGRRTPSRRLVVQPVAQTGKSTQ